MELIALRLNVKQQSPIAVIYHGEVIGDFFADLIVDDRLIIELKAVQKLSREHEVQLVNYLTATDIDDGLLINFGSSVEVKRKHRQYNKP
jgi:GxxExxY protein